jgi:hypothetical protein
MVAGHLVVDDAERLDNRVVGIGQQRVSDLNPIGEILQNRKRVIAEGRNIDAALLIFFPFTLQLDQLAFAVISPIGRAVEQKQ